MTVPSIFSLIFKDDERRPYLVRAVAHFEPALKVIEAIIRKYPLKIELASRLHSEISEKNAREINKLIKRIYFSGKSKNFEGEDELAAAAQLRNSFSAYSRELEKSGNSEYLNEARQTYFLFLNLHSSLEREFEWVSLNYGQLFYESKNPISQKPELRLGTDALDKLAYLEQLIKGEGAALFGANQNLQFAAFAAEVNSIAGKTGFKIKFSVPHKISGNYLTLYHYSRRWQSLKAGDLLRATEGESGFFASFSLKELQEYFEGELKTQGGKESTLVLMKVNVAEGIFNDLFQPNPSEHYSHSYFIPVKKYYLANKHIIAGNLSFEII